MVSGLFKEARSYYSAALLLFVMLSAFSLRMKFIYYGFFIFIAFPWIFWLFKNRKENFHLSREALVWALFLIWIALQECFLAVSTEVRYIKYALYTAIFVMFSARLVSMRIFRSTNILRSAFWVLVAYSLLALLVDWYKGVWYPGGRLFFLQPTMSPYFYPYLLNMLFALLLPGYLSARRLFEITYTLSALLFVNAICFASRSALLGTAVVLLVSFVLYLRNQPRLAVRYLIAMVLLTTLGFIIFQQLPFLHHMIKRGDSYRFLLWSTHLQNLIQYKGILFGLGQNYIDMLQPENKLLRPHNLYVAILVYHGIFALVLWLGLCIMTLHKAWKNNDPWGIVLLAGLTEAAFMSEDVVGKPDAFWILILLPMGFILNTEYQNNGKCFPENESFGRNGEMT